MIYQMQEGYLALAGPWQDQSVNVLVPEETLAKGSNLVVSRDVLPKGAEFPDYLATQRKTFAKELPDFQSLADAEATLAGQPARFFEFTWSSQGGPLHQMVFVVPLGERILNLTGTLPGQPDAAALEQMLAVLRTFQVGLAPAPAASEA
jgi:hypothetical protein